MIRQLDQEGTVSTPTLPRAMRPRRRKQRGAIAQVVLFISIWSTFVSLFGFLAVLPALGGILEQSGVVGPDGRVAIDLDADQLNALLTASSATTLSVAFATALGTVLSVWIMQRFFDGPSLLDLGLAPRPGWLADSVIGLVLGPVMFLAILLVLLAAGWASIETGSIGVMGLLTAFATYVLVGFSEEVFARGWVLQVLERGRGTTFAVIGSAAVFSVLHAFNHRASPELELQRGAAVRISSERATWRRAADGATDRSGGHDWRLVRAGGWPGGDRRDRDRVGSAVRTWALARGTRPLDNGGSGAGGRAVTFRPCGAPDREWAPDW
jgi:membrane protease YdiL (CAAX protease family)